MGMKTKLLRLFTLSVLCSAIMFATFLLRSNSTLHVPAIRGSFYMKFQWIKGLVGTNSSVKRCGCRACISEPGVSPWFDERYNRTVRPLLMKSNAFISEDTYVWWLSLQKEGNPKNITTVIQDLFETIPGADLYTHEEPDRCRKCAVVGNSGNLKGSGYGNQIDHNDFVMRMNHAPTTGFESDVGSKTTHHFMYPESAKNLPANVSLVLIPFKTLDLQWVISALTTGSIKSTYAPVKQFLRVDKDKVQIYNPAFFKYIHDKWTEHHGRYPSTGMLVLFFALHVCDEVDVYGFGADSRGNWHHYWENNRYAGEFRKTGVHDADFEAHIIDSLVQIGKIRVYRGK
ncbi:CMP-N-acetylneuraminate-beta-galactosamide-alpha-2,3-sialyltransferase 2-like [Latimeria chalumnae]|uniref:CMP-N-acetylneuraminate-beta-galactosamide-alpha-2,3-sialyltransferase 2 n=2 Tax=Latimeria chalumnae TaxID=7897 RepID=A0A0F7RQW0_LATCH|nr:CMP-N-acetylneuraminate-beta-galactosamide-alpha-2,3-sialyltransferase 2-like [Latimeria chalumnae]XP_006005772.2 PREDICTED: CMP-N-acetylneuraminate-beta-galactosamide-alpha-2,3-sialyltransferase 2-like [Latimeria chalumnae]CDI70265.1 TPA: alpha2,3-sialyltransferase [Latimeria chalumnae]|eukprot:XP_006005772.2 PREDICTED: CMP-N-acetylneuraminate-beta-galactosamide-alpha-2,3-sialyltransferase 2-like [Latimeria chalumnae]